MSNLTTADRPQNAITRLFGVRNAVEEDTNEPLERVLVHRIDVGQIGDTEEQDLCVDGDWDVLTPSYVDVSLCLLCDYHLRLSSIQQGQSH